MNAWIVLLGRNAQWVDSVWTTEAGARARVAQFKPTQNAIAVPLTLDTNDGLEPTTVEGRDW